MKLVWFSVLAVLLLVTPALAVEPKTEDEKTIYAIGLAFSQNVAWFGLSPQELELVKSGLADGLAGKKNVDLTVYGPKIQELQRTRMAAVAENEKKAGQAYLDKAASEKGAKKLPSGVIITTIKPGTGPSPSATDKVKVHYHGTLTDGTVFDSSVQRNEPAVLPLDHVIKCWTEGVPEMKVGGKAKLVCPADLAYGDRGAPPRIKPGATLVFEIELLGIEK
jgi:FKBP-type peptidyl-prolyl cis-trans isomerase FkpA